MRYLREEGQNIKMDPDVKWLGFFFYYFVYDSFNKELKDAPTPPPPNRQLLTYYTESNRLQFSCVSQVKEVLHQQQQKVCLQRKQNDLHCSRREGPERGSGRRTSVRVHVKECRSRDRQTCGGGDI